MESKYLEARDLRLFCLRNTASDQDTVLLVFAKDKQRSAALIPTLVVTSASKGSKIQHSIRQNREHKRRFGFRWKDFLP